MKKKLSRLSVSEENEEDESLNASYCDSVTSDSDMRLWTDSEDDSDLSESEECPTGMSTDFDQQKILMTKARKQSLSLRKLSISTSSIERRNNSRSIQPHIIYIEIDIAKREVNSNCFEIEN